MAPPSQPWQRAALIDMNTMAKPAARQLGRPASLPAAPARAATASATRTPTPTISPVSPSPNLPCLCPMTGQPDFAISSSTTCRRLARRVEVAQALSQQLPQSRRVPRRLHGRDRQEARRRAAAEMSCASAAICIRAAACRSTCSGRPGRLPAGIWVPDQGVAPIAARLIAGDAVQRAQCRWFSSPAPESAARMTPPMTASRPAPAAISSPPARY